MHKSVRLALLLSLLLMALAVFPAAAQDDAPTLGWAENETYGPILVDANGMTLYIFTRDALNTSNCVDRCAENWPPLTVESADAMTVADGIPGTVGTTERADGTLQVTYNGWPLYTWVNDAAAGDTTGHRVGRVWWVAQPSTAGIGMNEELGAFLTGPNGMTVYIFTNDEPGVSNCVDQCATNWPPLTVESADALMPNAILPGEWSTVERADGTLQVAYNGWPLYYWKDDAAIGDTTGQGVGDVWWVVKPETVAVANTDELGDFLTSFDGMTLYMFTNDEAGVSNCADQCAENWPPYTVSSADALAAGPNVTGTLGTIERADGALQVTYNDMPLYFWKDDAAPGDTTGQGVGDVWYVVAP
jgi:predicted lipoprotein with Yx(FWY)xxD motif